MLPTNTLIRVLVGIVLAASACTAPQAPPGTVSSGGAATAEKPAGGGKLVVGLVAEPNNLDVHDVGDSNGRRATFPMFDGLVNIDEKGVIVPELAERWQISADGKEYTFFLRKETIKFHDGTEFNSDAVKFSLERQLFKEHPFYDSGTFSIAKGFLNNLDRVEVVDPKTVKLILKSPQGSYLESLTTQAGRIISPAAMQKYGKSFGQNPVGSGPFRLLSYQKGVQIVLERNPEYWGTKPLLDQLIFVSIVEPQARIAALQTGTIDFTTDPAPDAVPLLERDSNLKVDKSNSRQVFSFYMSLKYGPFKEKAVRQAMAYAINREAIIKDVLRGTGTLAFGHLSPAYGDWVNSGVARYSYDPAKAKAMLAAAGYPNGFPLTISTAQSGVGYQQPVEITQVIQANLAAVGVTAKIEVLEFAAFTKKFYAGDIEAAAAGQTPLLGDPDNPIYLIYNSKGGFNWCSYRNDEVDRLTDLARASSDRAERVKLYQEAQRLIAEDSPAVWIDHETQYFVMKKNVQGLVYLPNFMIAFNKATVRG